jgi:CHAT domain-containing protein
MTAEAIRCVRNALGVLMLTALCACRAEESPFGKLRALTPNSGRPIEARLTGFDWPEARLQRATHASLLDPARLELAGAAGAVIQSVVNDSSARARHEAGAAYLLIDRGRDAIDALESAVRQSPDNPACWSDLSAARYTVAVTEKRPHELPQALADADHALRLDPKLHDALFNRALIIEALGISEAARRAWQRYAAADPSSHWSTEAMHHLGDLPVVTTRDEFQHHLAAATHALPDTTALIALARNFPQEARTWSEGPLLAQWADAVRKGDTKNAAETLTVVRTLGTALAEFNRVQMVSDIVATIDHANAADARTIAEAHSLYRDGRVLYRDRRIADAQTKLQEARVLFVRTASPMALITDYYLGSCLYDSNHIADAVRALDAVAVRFDQLRYSGLAAEIDWERALCQAAAGDWEDAIRKASRSRKTFDRLGEIDNRAHIDVLLASHLNHASQPAAAWRARVAAFTVLSRSASTDGIRDSLVTAIYAEVAQGKTAAALALADLALNDVLSGRASIASTLIEAARAEALADLHDTTAARRAIERARSSAERIPDTDLRQRNLAAINIAEGVVERNESSGISLRLLNSAIAFYTEHAGNTWLPKAYLERGRTQVYAKNDAAALADFESGLRILNVQRSSVRQRDARETFYDSAPELFSESISLLLRRGDIPHALQAAESGRARSIYEPVSETAATVTPALLQKAMPHDAVLIEYAFLSDSFVIFYVSSTEWGVVRVATRHSDVRALVEHCNHLLQQRGDIAELKHASAALYGLLIAPVASRLTGAHTLIIAPDRELHAVAFAALFDAPRKRYLIDDAALMIVPNAGCILRHQTDHPLTPVLVVSGPYDEETPALPAAAEEAAGVARIYESPTFLAGDRATRARFITAATHSGLIHYAGHADSKVDPLSVLHLSADTAGGSGDLDANAVAALHLTNAPLVILAACGTMRGESEHVEGMPSISRAFLAAGARTVVGTLWEIDDGPAASLFRELHLELRKGKAPSAALRTAQMAFAHSDDEGLSHPATWAPVEVLGYAPERSGSGIGGRK